MSTRRKRGSRRALMALVAVAALAATLAGPVAAPVEAAECTITNPSHFLNAVKPNDKCDYHWFETALAATGKLTTLGVEASMLTYPTDEPVGQPGDLIRIRPLYPSPAGPTTMSARIMYWTKDRSGATVPATGLVVTSRVRPAAGEERPIVVWNHGTAGISRGCIWALDALMAIEPSKKMRNQLVRPYTDDAYHAVVALPDYIGIGAMPQGDQYHSYMVAEEMANASIDMVRAVRNMGAATSVGNKFAAMGHSQGAAATQAVGERVDAYAPELDAEGLVALAPAGDLSDVPAVFKDSEQYFMGIALLGMKQAYPELNVNEVLTSNAQFVLSELLGNGSESVIRGLAAGVDIAQLITPDGIFYDLAWNNVDQRPLNDLYQQSNLRYATPSRGKIIAGCTALAPVLGASFNANQPMFKAGYQSTATWDLLMDEILPENSYGHSPTSAPIRLVAMNCDGLSPLAYRPSDKARLPMCDNSAKGTVTPAPNEYELPEGYVIGPTLETIQRLCTNGSAAVNARIYGELDFNADGITDSGTEINGNGIPDVKYDHSAILDNSVLPDAKAWLEAVWGTGIINANRTC